MKTTVCSHIHIIIKHAHGSGFPNEWGMKSEILKNIIACGGTNNLNIRNGTCSRVQMWMGPVGPEPVPRRG